jgi:glutathione S-transferase
VPIVLGVMQFGFAAHLAFAVVAALAGIWLCGESARRLGVHDHPGADEDERREILRWLLWDNHKLTSYIGTLRFLLRFMKTGETPVTEFLRARMKSALTVLDGHLASRAFVTGAEPTIADLSICGYLYFADEFDVDWADYPNIGAWLGRIKALPGWVHPYELMPGHPLPA